MAGDKLKKKWVKGSANHYPHHTPPIIQPSTSQPQKKQKPRKPRRKDTKVPQPSGPTDNVADEAVYKEMDDNLEWATTTATSLDKEWNPLIKKFWVEEEASKPYIFIGVNELEVVIGTCEEIVIERLNDAEEGNLLFKLHVEIRDMVTELVEGSEVRDKAESRHCWDLRFDDYKTKYARLKKDETTRT
ncbi:hypothetical protein Tco_1215982 [Tanacetum coccineum]